MQFNEVSARAMVGSADERARATGSGQRRGKGQRMRSAWSEFIAAAAARGGIGHAVRCLRTRRLPPSGNHCLHDDPLARIDDAIRQRRCCPKAAQRTRPHWTDDTRVCRSGAVVQAAPDRAVQLQRRVDPGSAANLINPHATRNPAPPRRPMQTDTSCGAPDKRSPFHATSHVD